MRPFGEMSQEESARKFPKVAEDGRRYALRSVYRGRTLGPRPNLCYEWRGFQNKTEAGWALSKDRLEEEYQKGNVVIRSDGKLERRQYVEDSKGSYLSNVWTDVPIASGKERTGYPTQKPLALYKRMIEASSNPGDIVLDPFAGCATTCVAAEQMGREWIAIDINEEAEDVILERLDREVDASMAWNDIIRTPTEAPDRTDDGKFAAPELILESPGPQQPKMSTAEVKARLLGMDGMVCIGCGWEPHHPDYLQVDHKKPKDKKGREVLSNFGLLCGPCNLKKGKKWTLKELHEQRIAEERMNMKWYEEDGKWK